MYLGKRERFVTRKKYGRWTGEREMEMRLS
jgi:hypothetical protein